MSTHPRSPSKPVQARPYSASKSNTNVGSATPKFTHFEKWETAVECSWTGLWFIHGQYNVYNNVGDYCTGFVLLITATGAGTRVSSLFAPHLHRKVGRIYIWRLEPQRLYFCQPSSWAATNNSHQERCHGFRVSITKGGL